MGSIVQAKCKCGYESEDLFLGGGMADFGKMLEVPYYCHICQHVGSLNLFKRMTTINMIDGVEPKYRKRLTCKKCRRKVQYYGNFQDDIEKPSIDEDEIAFQWRIPMSSLDNGGDYTLSRTKQYCPKCKNISLLFYDVGSWD
jgi:hypothetical protein